MESFKDAVERAIANESFMGSVVAKDYRTTRYGDFICSMIDLCNVLNIRLEAADEFASSLLK